MSPRAQGPRRVPDTQADFVADTVVTRVGNAGDVVENYVEKQVDYFTGDFPTPPTGTSEVASVPASVQPALKAVESRVGKDVDKDVAEAAPTGGKRRRGLPARCEVARRRPTQSGQGHRQGAG